MGTEERAKLARMIVSSSEFKAYKGWLRDQMLDTARMRSLSLSGDGVPQSDSVVYFYLGKMSAFADIHDFLEEKPE